MLLSITAIIAGAGTVSSETIGFECAKGFAKIDSFTVVSNYFNKDFWETSVVVTNSLYYFLAMVIIMIFDLNVGSNFLLYKKYID